jgi:rubrerythrin
MTTNATPSEALPRLLDVREFVCCACGYGIVVRRDPPACPMCRGCDWTDRSSFTHWN